MNIAELLAQLPMTDVELDVLKAAQQPPSDKPKPPPPANPATEASKFTGPEPALAEKFCDQILTGGRAALLELLNLIQPVTDPAYQCYKAEYLFHCLTIHVGRAGKERFKHLLAEFLADQIGNAKLAVPVRLFLVRELQLIAGKESVRALGQLLTDDALCQPAAAALVIIGTTGIEQLQAYLPKAKGKCRLNIVQSLAALGSEPATGALRKALQDPDQDVRAVAAWGLARLGDANSIDVLLKAADVEPSFVRTKAAQTCLVLAEALIAKGRKREAARIYEHLRDTRTGPKEQYLRDLASKALNS